MLLHASCVALNDQAVLLTGPSGVGKSDLALRLIIETGAVLVSDDQTLLRQSAFGLIAEPPATIAGLFEVRHVGLMHLPYQAPVTVGLYVELAGKDDALERLPEPDRIFLLDHAVRKIRLPARIGSTPAKIAAILRYALVDKL